MNFNDVDKLGSLLFFFFKVLLCWCEFNVNEIFIYLLIVFINFIQFLDNKVFLVVFKYFMIVIYL